MKEKDIPYNFELSLSFDLIFLWEMMQIRSIFEGMLMEDQACVQQRKVLTFEKYWLFFLIFICLFFWLPRVLAASLLRGWDGWMASPTWWTWIWANFRSWWWTGKPGMLQSKGSESQMWLSEWTELNWYWKNYPVFSFDVEKACNTMQYPFIIRTLKKLGI